MNKTTRRGPNKKRLIIELFVIGAIVLGVILWRFLPWFFVQPTPPPSYSQYERLYDEVMNYDFSKGPSENLEKRLDRAIDSFVDPAQYYYNLKARIEYNHHLGNDDKVKEDLEEARDYAPTEEEELYIFDLHEKISQNDETS